MFVESLVGYHQTGCCVLESRSWRGVLDTTFCDKTCQWLAAGRLFSPGTPVFSTNKTYRHDITEILLKVALNTITITLTPNGKIQQTLNFNKKNNILQITSLIYYAS